MTWKIWGDGVAPLFEGTKDEVIAEYKAKYVDNESTYIEDPDGNEYAWSDGLDVL